MHAFVFGYLFVHLVEKSWQFSFVGCTCSKWSLLEGNHENLVHANW